MTVSQLKQQFKNELNDLYPETEIESFFFLLAEEYLKQTRLDLALNPSIKISSEAKVEFTKAIQKLQQF